MDVFVLVATKHFDGSEDFHSARVFASFDQAKCTATVEENCIIDFQCIDECTWWSIYQPGLKFDYQILHTKVVE